MHQVQSGFTTLNIYFYIWNCLFVVDAKEIKYQQFHMVPSNWGVFAYSRAKHPDHPEISSVFLMVLQAEDDSQGLGWHSPGGSWP